MKQFLIVAAMALTMLGNEQGDQKGDAKGYVQLFNGKDLTGWKTHPDAKGKWQVKDGAIVGSGTQISHLYTERGDYENFHYRIEAKINDKGNSGQYFRAVLSAGFPLGTKPKSTAPTATPSGPAAFIPTTG